MVSAIGGSASARIGWAIVNGHAVGIECAVKESGRPLRHAGYDVGAHQEPVFSDERRVRIGSGKNHVGAPALVMLNSCNAPAAHNLACRAADVGKFLARAEGELVGVGDHEVVGVVVDAQGPLSFGVV